MRWQHATLRLPAPAPGGEAETPTTVYQQIQVAYNRVARSITGVRIRDSVSVPDLLERADIPSMNAMIINAVATEARNFVGAVIFDTGVTVKATRATSAGMATVPLRGKDTFVSNGARTWNASEALWEEATKTAAR
jgi:hypothetical protein